MSELAPIVPATATPKENAPEVIFGVTITGGSYPTWRRFEVGPLTTVFAPEPGCEYCSVGQPDTLVNGPNSYGFSTRQQWSQASAVCTAFKTICGSNNDAEQFDNGCLPHSTTTAARETPTGYYWPLPVYSPGLHCPLGWNVASTLRYDQTQKYGHTVLRDQETMRFCCPAGWQFDGHWECKRRYHETATLASCYHPTGGDMNGLGTMTLITVDVVTTTAASAADPASADFYNNLEVWVRAIALVTGGSAEGVVMPTAGVSASGSSSPTETVTNDGGGYYANNGIQLGTRAFAAIISVAILVPLLCAAAIGVWFVRRKKKRVDAGSKAGDEDGAASEGDASANMSLDDKKPEELDSTVYDAVKDKVELDVHFVAAELDATPGIVGVVEIGDNDRCELDSGVPAVVRAELHQQTHVSNNPEEKPGGLER